MDREPAQSRSAQPSNQAVERERGPVPRIGGKPGRYHHPPRARRQVDLRQPGLLRPVRPVAGSCGQFQSGAQCHREDAGRQCGRRRARPLGAADRDRQRATLVPVGGLRHSRSRRRSGRNPDRGPRHHRPAQDPSRPRPRQETGRGGQPGQVHVPGHHEPRNPDPDERCDRHGRPAQGHQSEPGAADLCQGDSDLGQDTAVDHRRDPGFFQDRGRQAGTRARAVQSCRCDRGCGRAAGAARPQQGHRNRLLHRPFDRDRCGRRRNPATPDHAQHCRQRDQVHRDRRRAAAGRTGRGPPGRRAGRPARSLHVYGYRHRHEPGGSGSCVQRVFTGRFDPVAQAWRHRARAVDLAAVSSS